MSGSFSSNCVKKVGVVVLNWNGAADTLNLLESLEAINYDNFEVLVVDNGSTDDSLCALKSHTSSFALTILETGQNLGYAGGNNVGIHCALQSSVDFVLILNNDMVVAADLVTRLVEAAERHPEAGVFSPRVLYMAEPDKVWFERAKWNEQQCRLEWPGQNSLEASLLPIESETDYACGAALFFRVEVAKQIGLLDEAFFLVWEEVDWCFRARKAGWHCLTAPRAKAWHKVGASFGNESAPLRTYFSIRNELLWFSRHARFPARLALWVKSLERLTPGFHLSSSKGTAFSKRLAWALHDFCLAWLGRGNRLHYLATRRAILDYFTGRFGDCPAEVRAWSQAWADKQRSH